MSRPVRQAAEEARVALSSESSRAKRASDSPAKTPTGDGQDIPDASRAQRFQRLLQPRDGLLGQLQSSPELISAWSFLRRFQEVIGSGLLTPTDMEASLLEPDSVIAIDMICRLLRWCLGREDISFDNWEDVAAVEVTHRHQAELALMQGDGSDMDPDGASETNSEDDHSGSDDTATFTGETGDDLLSWLRQGRWVPYVDLRPDLRAYLVHELCCWCAQSQELQHHIDQKPADTWRTEPVGQDQRGNTFWHLGHSRIYCEVIWQMASQDIGWYLVCSTLHEWQELIDFFSTSRFQCERDLHKRLSQDIFPLYEKELRVEAENAAQAAGKHQSIADVVMENDLLAAQLRHRAQTRKIEMAEIHRKRQLEERRRAEAAEMEMIHRRKQREALLAEKQAERERSRRQREGRLQEVRKKKRLEQRLKEREHERRLEEQVRRAKLAGRERRKKQRDHLRALRREQGDLSEALKA